MHRVCHTPPGYLATFLRLPTLVARGEAKHTLTLDNELYLA